MRRPVVLLCIPIGIFIIGAVYPLRGALQRDPVLDPATPEGVAQAAGGCGFLRATRDFRVLHKRALERGTLVAYRSACLAPFALSSDLYGFVVVEQLEGGRQRPDLAASSHLGAVRQGDLAQFFVAISQPDAPEYTAIFGRVLTPEATAVEGTFGDGQRDRAALSSPGFAVLAHGTTQLCGLRVLGDEGKVLQELDLSGDC